LLTLHPLFWFTEEPTWDEHVQIRSHNNPLPEPPIEFSQEGTTRNKEPITVIYDIPLRHVNVRPQRNIQSLAPMSGYLPSIPPAPMTWQTPIEQLIPEGFQSSLNMDYLANHAKRILEKAGDPIAGVYMSYVYKTGGIDHCKLPANYERYSAPNKVTQRGDKLSEA
jgi:hypothetical protein